jgi:two-component system, sensor histidine kinase LadS
MTIAPSGLRLLLIGTLVLISAMHSGEIRAETAARAGLDISNLEHESLRGAASFWVTEEDLTPAQLPYDHFQPLTPDQLNRGVTGKYHWVRVRLSNADSEEARHWVLYHETSYLDELLVHYADNGQSQETVTLSDRVPFHERPVNHRTLAFQHTTPAGGYTDLLLRLHFHKADTLTLNLLLSDVTAFEEKARLENLVYGGYYGLMATLLVIAVIFACILRQWVYLNYAAFLVFSILMWAALNGFSFQYLWPGSVFWHNEGFHIIFLMMAITALQFSRGFLKTRTHFPRVHRCITIAQGVMVGGILLRLVGVYVPVLALSFLALSVLVLLAPLGLMAYRKGLRYARWYAIAWAIYGLGLTFSVLSASTSVFSWGMSPLNYAQAGGALEAIFLLIALGERLVSWDRDRRQALEIAHQDALTKLGNRRALEEGFGAFQDRFLVQGLPVFLIMIDLDHFKEINDRYGHDAGDTILVRAGKIIRNGSRPQDVCTRFGGEEFAILLQAPSIQQAWEVAERIRVEFAANPTMYQGNIIEHTLTAGITPVMMGDQLMPRSQIIQQADQALYHAKHAGRNQTCIFDQTAEAATQFSR